MKRNEDLDDNLIVEYTVYQNEKGYTVATEDGQKIKIQNGLNDFIVSLIKNNADA